MRISPISNYQLNYYCKKPSCNAFAANKQLMSQSPNFNGKYSTTKFFTGICGTMAFAGVTGFAIFSSGGLAAIPYIIGYSALGAGIGAVLGHTVDKGAEKFDEENKKSEDLNKELHIQA